jgi:hypothetical protein
VTLLFNAILTAPADVWSEDGDGATCHTDSSLLVNKVPWFHIPYPGQWGAGIFEAYAILPML